MLAKAHLGLERLFRILSNMFALKTYLLRLLLHPGRFYRATYYNRKEIIVFSKIFVQLTSVFLNNARNLRKWMILMQPIFNKMRFGCCPQKFGIAILLWFACKLVLVFHQAQSSNNFAEIPKAQNDFETAIQLFLYCSVPRASCLS
jgi:hypothetical protein